MANVSNWLNRYGLYIALAAAWIATLGSLYFSEVAGYLPCTLCWYQRILMYPLAVILLVGLLRTDEHLPYYVLPLSIFGLGIGLYHYLLQKGMIGSTTACQAGVPCTTMWINWWGVVTIPFLSMLAFLIITAMTLNALLVGEPDPDEVEDVPWRPVLATVVPIAILFVALFWVGGQSAAASDHAVGLTLDESLAATDAMSSADAVTEEGALLYTEACAACHGAAGEGVAGLGSALADAPFIAEQTDDELLAFIRQGREADAPENQSGLVMPPSGGRPDLTDAEMLSIIAFLRSNVDTTSAVN